MDYKFNKETAVSNLKTAGVVTVAIISANIVKKLLLDVPKDKEKGLVPDNIYVNAGIAAASLAGAALVQNNLLSVFLGGIASFFIIRTINLATAESKVKGLGDDEPGEDKKEEKPGEDKKEENKFKKALRDWMPQLGAVSDPIPGDNADQTEIERIMARAMAIPVDTPEPSAPVRQLPAPAIEPYSVGGVAQGGYALMGIGNVKQSAWAMS
ncbi:MAG: hypothetical protein M9892_07585 [Bacteroidetes bacterium]|nr:hypothetical protein [Bacteroidota bacterium]